MRILGVVSFLHQPPFLQQPFMIIILFLVFAFVFLPVSIINNMTDVLQSHPEENESISREVRKSTPESDDETTATENSTSDQQQDGMDVLVGFFEGADLTYHVLRENVLDCFINANSGTFRFITELKPENKLLLAYFYCGARVPNEKLLPMAEFIARANYGLYLGNFELDFRDGELRYKVVIDFSGANLTNNMVESLFTKGAGTMARYFPAAMRVIYGQVNPVDAIERVEIGGADPIPTCEAIAVPVGDSAGQEENEHPPTPATILELIQSVSSDFLS